MTLFANSQTTVSAAVQQIADSVGASADPEMLGRAFVSLNAATKHFNSRTRWNWLWAEATPVAVVGAFSVAVTASAAQTSAVAPAGHGLKVDDFVVGSGFSAGTRVTATAAAGFGFNVAITGFTAGLNSYNATVGRDWYDLPADYQDTFSARTLSNNMVLRPVQRRAYDRTVDNEFTTSTPVGYTLFQVGAKGKIQLVPAPAAADVLQMRYFRAMATASASGTTSTLDIPSDYDPYLIAWAKWHCITDKGEGRAEQGKTWLALAQEGLVTMLRDQVNVQDQDLGFSPGASSNAFGSNDRSTRDIGWDYSGGG